MTTLTPSQSLQHRSPPPFRGRATRRDTRLLPIVDKVQRGERLSVDDGVLLYETPDTWTVCELADLVRRRLHGDVAYYNINRHLNYSNICALSCRCSSGSGIGIQDWGSRVRRRPTRHRGIKGSRQKTGTPLLP